MKVNPILAGPVAALAARPNYHAPATALSRTGRGMLFCDHRDPLPAYVPTTTKAAADMTEAESRAELHSGMKHMLKSQTHDREALEEFRKGTDTLLAELKTAAKDRATESEELNKKVLALQRSIVTGAAEPQTADRQTEDVAASIARRFPNACKAVAEIFISVKGMGPAAMDICPEGGVVNIGGQLNTKAESTANTSGQAVLSPEITLDIFDLLLTYGAFRDLDVRRMSTKQQRLIVKNGRPTAFWVPENGEIPESGINLGTLFLTAGLLGVIDGFSKAFLDDSPIDLGAMILADFLEACAYRMDYSCFLGDGTNDAGGINGGILGIVNAGTVVTAGTGGTTVAAMKYADILAVQTGAPQAIYGRSPMWWMNPLIFGAFLGIMDLNGRPLFQPALNAPAYGSIGSINGFPVRLTNVLPGDNSAGKPIAIFGDGKAYAAGVRQDFSFAFSDDVRFTSNQRVFRGLMRGTGGMKNALALRVFKTAAN